MYSVGFFVFHSVVSVMLWFFKASFFLKLRAHVCFRGAYHIYVDVCCSGKLVTLV